MMNGIEQSWLWITGAVMLLVGLGAGLLLARQLLPGAQKARELEKELETTKAEQARYRQQVTEHFEKTGELFQEMAQGYRSVYDHLARGAHQLCSEGTQTPRLDLPDAKLLAGAAAGAEQPAAGAADPVKPEAPPAATQSAGGEDSTQSEKVSPQTPAPERSAQEADEGPSPAAAGTASSEVESSAPREARGDDEPEASEQPTAKGEEEKRPAVH